MADWTVEREILIEAPVDVVWRTVTEPDQITRWWPDRADFRAAPGEEGSVSFEHDDGTVNTVPIVVETVDAPRRFSFRWNHPEGEAPVDGNSVLVTFTLIEDGPARTRLKLVETGLELLMWPDHQKDEYAADHDRGWALFVPRLAGLYSEQG